LSRIEEALRRLQRRPQSGTQSTPASPQPRSVVPVAGKKKVAIDGEKYHVSHDDLVRDGLLAPEQGVFTDEFRRIKRPLIANALRTGPDATPRQNVIMVSSGLPGAGKTFCSVNLAVSISLERELNVLLVDADVAKPHISRAFGLAEAPGLIDLLLNERSDIADLLVRTDLNDILVLPAGRRHDQATELLASERMSSLVAELATRYSDRIVLLDSPPLLLTSEAQALADQVGQIVVVVEAGETSQQSLKQTMDALDTNKAVNLLLNKVRHLGRSGGQYGDYGRYGYEGR
jgi:protein-tyrosine kinase